MRIEKVKAEADAVDLTAAEIKEALARPPSFGYHGDNRDVFDTWALGPVIETRDSTLVDKSNAEVLKQFLTSDESLESDWQIEHCGHWAVGWVDHLSYRVVDGDGKATRIARLLKVWFAALAIYPIADEHDHSAREYEATLDNIRDVGRRLVKDGAPTGWESDVYRWFSDNNESAIEDRSDQGGYPSDEDMKECLSALGLLDVEE